MCRITGRAKTNCNGRHRIVAPEARIHDEQPADSASLTLPLEVHKLFAVVRGALCYVSHKSSSHSVTMRPAAWMSTCRSGPFPELTNLWGMPAGTTMI